MVGPELRGEDVLDEVERVDGNAFAYGEDRDGGGEVGFERPEVGTGELDRDSVDKESGAGDGLGGGGGGGDGGGEGGFGKTERVAVMGVDVGDVFGFTLPHENLYVMAASS